MKNMIILFSLSLFVFSLVAIAQPRVTPQERLKALKEKLNLTEDQSVKVEKILVNADEQMKKLRANGNTDRTDFRNLMDKTNQEIDKVLDEKQKIEHKKMMDERRNRRQQNLN
jgi:ribosome recycling factor